MPRLRYLQSAKSDLVEILDYITRQSGSLTTGQRFVGQIRKQCKHLAELPGHLGRARPDLHPDLRSFAFRGYIFFFRYCDDHFEIVNILEGHRDVQSSEIDALESKDSGL